MLKNYTQKKLPDAALELIAQQFKALSEPPRLRLLTALAEGEKNVTELVAATKLSQTGVSRHLATLADAGLVTRKKAGQSVYYRVADDAVFAMCHLVCDCLQRRLARQPSAASLFGE